MTGWLIYPVPFIVLGYYAYLIIRYGRALKKHGEFAFNPGNYTYRTKVSVIVACRNELHNLPHLITNLYHQRYPKDWYEILLVDDHSHDGTWECIMDWAECHPNIKGLKLPTGIEGKKNAVMLGVQSSEGSFILTTDADCRLNEDWIACHVAYHECNNTTLQMAWVEITADLFFQKLQRVEFRTLIASACGSTLIGKPILSNAANFSFLKDFYLKNIGGIKPEIPTGDDMFLLESAKYDKNSTIGFVKSKQALVYTQPVDNLSSFLHQRLRWASKSRYFTHPDIVKVGLTVAMTNLFLCLGWLFSPFLQEMYWITLIFFVIKLIADLCLYIPASRFAGKFDLPLFLFLSFVYPFYSLGISVASLFKKYRWKGR